MPKALQSLLTLAQPPVSARLLWTQLSHRTTSQILSRLCLYQQPWDEVKGFVLFVQIFFLLTVAEYT